MTSNPASVSLEEATAALELLAKADRDWVLSLPPREATRVVEALVAFPGSVFAEDGSVALDLFSEDA